MSAHVPRNRRKGREHLDARVQDAPAAPVNTAVRPGSADLSVFAAMWDDDARKKSDETRRQTVKLDLARRDDDDADRRRRIEEAARRRRQEEERHRREVADENRRKAVLRDDATAAAAADAQRRKLRREMDRKPVEVFDKMPSGERIASLFEAIIKGAVAGGLAAWLARRGRDVQRIASYVLAYVVPPLPEYREVFGPARPALPAPEAVMAPSAEKRPLAQPAAAPAPKAEWVPVTQADHDWKARREWNPAEARKRAAEFYGNAAVLGAVALTLERGRMMPFDEDAIGTASSNLLKLLSGGYGEEPFEAYRRQFADLSLRLKNDIHAADRLMEPMLKAADALEREPRPDLEPDTVPTDPPGSFDAGDEAEAPEAAVSLAPTLRPGMKTT